MKEIEDEREVEAYLRKACARRGWICWKFNSTNTRGVPDRVVIREGGRTAFIEVKRPGGRLSPMQKLRHRELAAAGADVATVYNRADVDALIARWTGGTP